MGFSLSPQRHFLSWHLQDNRFISLVSGWKGDIFLRKQISDKAVQQRMGDKETKFESQSLAGSEWAANKSLFFWLPLSELSACLLKPDDSLRASWLADSSPPLLASMSPPGWMNRKPAGLGAILEPIDRWWRWKGVRKRSSEEPDCYCCLAGISVTREREREREREVRLRNVTGQQQLKGSDRRESKKVSQAKSSVNKSRHVEVGTNFLEIL